MDSRVILATLEHNNAIRLPELDGARTNKPSLRSDGPIEAGGTVSLIVPTFFNAELKRHSLRRLLDGLDRSSAVKEVILVSSDGEQRAFQELMPLIGERPLRVVESEPHNRGKSRNAGAAAASGEFLLYLDDDMLPKDWRSVDVILSHMLQRDLECALFPRRNYARFPLLYDPHCLETTIRAWQRGAHDPFLFDPLHEGAPDLPMLFCFPGCFMLVRRDSYQALGGFNESFEGWGFEDTDFAFRAIKSLRVLNLFRTGEPLLHIDHPVSPYKSEEHRANGKKFFRAATPVEVHIFCRSVFTGDDFLPAEPGEDRRELYLEPFRRIVTRDVPLELNQVEHWACAVANDRIKRFMAPTPEFILLHGSRATGRGHRHSDYDLLCIYRGPIQEFFVTNTVPAIELECGYLEQFQAIAADPSQFGVQGVFEIAKIAKAKLLVGDEPSFTDWRAGLFENVRDKTRLYWLALALGVHLNGDKHGVHVRRLTDDLGVIFEMSGHEADTAEFVAFDLYSFAMHVSAAFDGELPEWRLRIEEGAKVFPFQAPEIWSAFRYLLARETKEKNDPQNAYAIEG